MTTLEKVLLGLWVLTTAPALGDELVATVGTAAGQAVHTWSSTDGWSEEPELEGPQMPFDVRSESQVADIFDSRSFTITNASGGAGCALHFASSVKAVTCSSGSCAPQSTLNLWSGDPATVTVVATPIYLLSLGFVFENRLVGTRVDTFTGEEMEISTPVSFSDALAIHAFHHADGIDVLVEVVENNQFTGRIVVLRIGLDGSLKAEFPLALQNISSADVHEPTGEIWAISYGTPDRLIRYDNDWVSLRSFPLSDSLRRDDGGLVVLDDDLFVIGKGDELLRYGLDGSRRPSIGLPPNAVTAAALHRRSCSPDDTSVRLGPQGRLELSGTVVDFQGVEHPLRFVPKSSRDSVEGYVFDSGNREGLFKALDACALNDRIWFFGAVATTTQFDLTVTDTESGVVRTFSNPRGQRAIAIEDTQSFPCN